MDVSYDGLPGDGGIAKGVRRLRPFSGCECIDLKRQPLK